MAVTVYRSTDSSAPTLSGTAGDLVNVLDKCLVAGYGSKTAAGWTKPFTGTNAAVFRMGGGNQFYLDVNDNAPGAATGQEARLRGYETMTAVATGTNAFPTAAQLASGIVIRKSAAASGTTRVWTLIADDRTFYLLIQAGDSAGVWYGFTFGDFYSFVTGTDNYRTLIIGRNAENTSSAANEQFDKTISGTGHYWARSHTGLGGSGPFLIDLASPRAGQSGTFFGSIPFPNGPDGNIWLAPGMMVDNSTPHVRGKLRGFVWFLHALSSFADQDTVTGAGVYAGHTFLLFKTSANGGVFTFDITGPWDTN
jgi:hypothetical protein